MRGALIAGAIGWTAVALMTLLSGFWAFWGASEAFHEGWCRPTLAGRTGQTLAYLAPAAALALLAAAGVCWPRVGGALLVLCGAAVAALIALDGARFGWLVTTLLTTAPMAIGALFWIGRPRPKRAALWLALGAPAVIAVACGAEPLYRVTHRFDDGDRGARLVEGSGVTLLWAPAGPGWTRGGLASWGDAQQLVRRLNEAGDALADQPQDIWRLPTRDEVVRSLTRGGRNAGGEWNPDAGRASYRVTPDKESPLWDPHAPLIYLWTSEEANERNAWIVVYHGGVFSKPKQVGSPSFGFRAVRTLPNGPPDWPQ